MLLHRIGSLRTLSFSLTCALLALGCGGQPKAAATAPEPAAQEAPKPAPAKQDSSKLFAREADPIAEQALTLTGTTRGARIESKTTPKIGKEGNVVTVDADLGWPAPVKCFLYSDSFDAGGSIAQLLKRLATVAKVRKVAPYAIENAGVDPIVFVRTLYEMPNDEGEMAIGDLKLMVSPREPGAVMCMLDAVGYAATFQRVAGNFARSLEYAEKPEPAKREELWITTIGDMPTGFSRWRLLPGGEKSAFLSITTSAKFFPTSETELSIDDSVSVTFLDKQGTVVEGTWAEFDAGEQTLLSKLTKTKNGYDYSGQLQGKPIQGSFSPKQPLTDDYAMNSRIVSLSRAGKAASFETTSYLPSLDPTGPSIASYKLAPSEGGFAVEGKLGNMTAYITTDAKGAAHLIRVPVSGRDLSSKLVFEQGAL